MAKTAKADAPASLKSDHEKFISFAPSEISIRGLPFGPCILDIRSFSRHQIQLTDHKDNRAHYQTEMNESRPFLTAALAHYGAPIP
jgi:hypothetical protein